MRRNKSACELKRMQGHDYQVGRTEEERWNVRVQFQEHADQREDRACAVGEAGRK